MYIFNKFSFDAVDFTEIILNKLNSNCSKVINCTKIRFANSNEYQKHQTAGFGPTGQHS